MSTAETFPTIATRMALAQLLEQHLACTAVPGSPHSSCGMAEDAPVPSASWQAAHLADAILRANYPDPDGDRRREPRSVEAVVADLHAWSSSGGMIAIPAVVLRETADLLFKAAQSALHTEECVRGGWSLLHRGNGPCACGIYGPDEVDAAARALDTAGLWDRVFAPNPGGPDRREQYRDMLRSQVHVVLAAIVNAAAA